MNDDLLSIVHEDELELSQPVWVDGDYRTIHDNVKLAVAEEKIPRTKLNLPVPYLSISQIQMYLKCPKQYEERYVEGKRTNASAALVQGSTIHTAVEKAYNYKIEHNGEDPPLEFVQDEYNDAFKKNFDDTIDREEWETDEFCSQLGDLLIKSWHKKRLPEVHPIAVEQGFIMSIADAPFVGFIDLIDRDFADYKNAGTTNFNPYHDVIVDTKVIGKAMSDKAASQHIQMSLYAAATGIPRQQFDMMIKGNPKSVMNAGGRAAGPRFSGLPTERTQAQVRWAKQVIYSVAKAISAGTFPMCLPDSWACSPKFCGYWASCRGRFEY